jgi:hypothetical protein
VRPGPGPAAHPPGGGLRCPAPPPPPRWAGLR